MKSHARNTNQGLSFASKFLRAAALSTLAVAAACSLAVDADRKQCRTTADCIGRGLPSNAVCSASLCTNPLTNQPLIGTSGDAASDAPTDPIWGCLANPRPLPPEEPSAPYQYVTGLVDLVTNERIVGAPVKACKDDDPSCEAPFATTVSNEEGAVDLQLYSGFRGYLEVGSSDSTPSLMPTLIYAQPIPDKHTAKTAITYLRFLLTTGAFTYVAGSANKTVNPEYGHLFFMATDCRGLASEDLIARVETVTAETSTFYTDSSGTPSLTQAKTTKSGNGGYLNLPVGPLTVKLSRTSGAYVGTAQATIRKGTITSLTLGPTP